MAGPSNLPGAEFAALLRRGRHARGWTQEELAVESGVAIRTILRWESGRTANPVADQVRAVLLALRIDPREAPVALGLVTREEMGLPAQVDAALDPSEKEVLEILRDPHVSDGDKAEWRDYLRWQYGRARKGTSRRRAK